LNQDRDPNRTELNSRKKAEVPVRELLHQEADVPLFLRDSSDGEKGDAQDEKDRTEEKLPSSSVAYALVAQRVLLIAAFCGITPHRPLLNCFSKIVSLCV